MASERILKPSIFQQGLLCAIECLDTYPKQRVFTEARPFILSRKLQRIMVLGGGSGCAPLVKKSVSFIVDKENMILW